MRTHKGHADGAPRALLRQPASPRSDEALRELAASARLMPNHAEAHIVIIDRRALVAECMASCLTSILSTNVASYASLESWLTGHGKPTASMIVYCSPAQAQSENGESERKLLAYLTERLPVVIVSDGENVDRIMAAIESGARGYIPTDLPLNVVVEAIRLVRAGGVYIPANSLLAARRSGEASSPRKQDGRMFTVRQAAVVQALCKGKANKLIAHELNMRESTVKVHVRNIMKKLSAKNRTEVALMASGFQF